MRNLKVLRSLLGSGLLTSKEEMLPYMTDASFFEGKEPLAVAIPETAKQVQSIVKFCNDNGIAIVARGGGTSLTGSSIPLDEFLVLSLARLNRIIEINTADRYVIAEPGVRVDDLNEELGKLDFFYPPDPASSQAATVGGTISTNAGGLRASMYGTTKDWVLGLDVVLPNGEMALFGGQVLKSSAGYDLTSLIIGAEGTLGIVTRSVLKIMPKPEKTGRILAYFDSIEKIGNAIRDLKASGITPLIAEFIDRITMNSLSKSRGLLFPDKASHMLILDVASTEESLTRNLEQAKSIIMKEGPMEVSSTVDPEEMARIYEARKGAYSSLLKERKTATELLVIGDVVVPTSKLPTALKEAEQTASDLGIRCALFGHISDGNIHANIFADLGNKELMERVDRYQMMLAEIAVRNGGMVSAEHGIGLEKKDLLLFQFKQLRTAENLRLMKEIKKVFDPNGIMNRGKIFD